MISTLSRVPPRAGGAPQPAALAEPWHRRSAADALVALRSSASGLNAAEAETRLAAAGPNRLPQAPERSRLLRFLLQFHNVLIYVLLASAAFSLVLGHLVDAAVILCVVLANALIGFIQEGRAVNALDAIRGMIDPKASVLRDGRRLTVAAEDIVPGDVVLIESGDRVPADLRLIRARNLTIDEAALTGESMAAAKTVEPAADKAVLADRTSMAYSGTFVAAGQAAGVVVGTGAATELGRISALIGSVEALETPLVRQMDRFAAQLTAIILAVAGLAFVFAYFVRGYALADAFMAVVGLSVAAIPEGLPATMTIALAIGVERMAARNAIIRRLPAVETLGSVSVICSDKTGTLTRNEMMARSIVTADGDYEVTGDGYAPDGAVTVDGAAIDLDRDGPLSELIRSGLLCNDAELRQAGRDWTIDGDPMEGALVTLAAKAGVDVGLARKDAPRTDEIPFDPVHRFMATLHHRHDGTAFILVKGAPERVLDMATLERTRDGSGPIDADRWRRAADRLAARGERVLAFAIKPAAVDHQTLAFGDVDHDVTLVGFVGFIDPPREEAIAAVDECRAAGVRVVMITGDHALTAFEIARQLGLAKEPVVVSGRQLDQLDDEALRRVVREADVFARATPEHKLHLVEALQADGLVVAMTGDGVNDAPALKRADVGIDMGRKGTEVAKEAAEMVLADDDFASIVAAIREGRTVYDNLIKVIAWTMPTNGGEAITIVVALALGLALPITPLQILWINMVTAVALGLTLVFEPTEPGTMRRPPRPAGTPILTGSLLWRMVFVSVLVVLGAFGLFFWIERRGLPVELARTAVVNALVVMEVFYLFSVRYVHGTSLTWQGVLGTPAVLLGVSGVTICQLAFTYLPPFQRVFDTVPLGPAEALAVIATGLVMLAAVEIEKALRRLW